MAKTAAVAMEPAGVTSGVVDDALGVWTYVQCRPARLAGLVDHIWLFDGSMTFLRERTFPNGLLEIIVHLGERYRVVQNHGTWLCPTTCVSGLQLGHLIVEAPARQTKVLGVRLTPAGAFALFARPMHDLASLTVDLEDVVGAAAEELAAQCDRAETAESCVAAALHWIEKRLAHATRLDPAIDWMLEAIRERHGAIPIGRLREQIGWSKTRLTTRFVEQVGVSPKQYARVKRFSRALQLIGTGATSLAEAAIDAGYYDQPHLNAEFKELSGFTPSEFLRSPRYPNTVSVAE